MGNDPNSSPDFYIGWQPEAPGMYAAKSKRFVLLLIFIIPLVAALLVLTQRGYKTSVFEFGQLTEVSGVLVKHPIPLLKVAQGTDAAGNATFKSILLVGFGKKGALPTLAEIENQENQNLDQQAITLNGSLLYHDGKTILELTEGTAAFVKKRKEKEAWKAQRHEFGKVTLRGEIYDPKCALGVMKPAEGKPHRSCAIRCISGGIPPVLKVANEEGVANYFLLLDPEGKAINQAVLDFVGDQIQICGRLEQVDDWLFLYTNPKEDILRLQPHWMAGDLVMCK